MNLQKYITDRCMCLGETDESFQKKWSIDSQLSLFESEKKSIGIRMSLLIF